MIQNWETKLTPLKIVSNYKIALTKYPNKEEMQKRFQCLYADQELARKITLI